MSSKNLNWFRNKKSIKSCECTFYIIRKDVLSSLITENSKYFDMVVELQQKTLDTFSNLTQKTTELNKNI